MNNKNLSFGVLLLSIGIIWALVNMGIITWSVFGSIRVLWPLIFVMIGVNVIFRNNEIVKALGWIVLLTVIVAYGYFNHGTRINTIESIVAGDGNKVTIEKLPETRNGELRLDLGVVRLDMGSGAVNLVEGVLTDSNTRYTVDYKGGRQTAEIRFRKDRLTVFDENIFEQGCKLDLNNDVVWDMKLNVGAVSGTVDMSGLKVKKFDMNTGAGNLKLIFGGLSESTDVNIDAGASKIDIVVPDGVGVRVDFDGGLNKTNLREIGWKRQNGNIYLSPNYDQSKAKINMEVDMGVGTFNVMTQ